eukprot:jgi/Tetstr1/441501/TSEL_029732.t1
MAPRSVAARSATPAAPRWSAPPSPRLREPRIAAGSHQARRHVVRAAASSPQAGTAASELAEELRSAGRSPNLMSASPELEARVEALLAGSEAGAPASQALELGNGQWEVFYMPHIKTIAGPLGLQVQPLRYTVQGGKTLQTDVRMGIGPGLSMWLSSTGGVRPEEGDAAVRLSMTEFWLSPPGATPRPVSDRDDNATGDVLVNWLSRAGFVEEFSLFPVLFFDADAGICVFSFPPLRSKIAAVRVSK